MGCRHAKDNICLILSNNCKCKIFNQDEERCSNNGNGIIYYLRYIGTYDKMVKNNPEYLAIPPEEPKHKKFIMNRFMKQN
jgi:hypothetical protein